MAEVECKGDKVMTDGRSYHNVKKCEYRKDGKCTAEKISIDFDDDGRIAVICPKA